MALFSKSGIASALLFAATAAFALAAVPSTKPASATQSVSPFPADKPINFPNQIVPIFTKAGCNGGGCHGKLAGQNGFRLSLLGFEPTEDYDWLVRESRGRRLSPAAPERSLLLLKATATLPHGGGKRLDPASKDYQLIVRWIAQGMPYGNPSDPVVASIEVLPRERMMPLAGEQQLSVVAHYSDGATEDVTESSLYDVNDKEVGSVSETGRFKTFRQPGEAAVMVRYQGQVAVFRRRAISSTNLFSRSSRPSACLPRTSPTTRRSSAGPRSTSPDASPPLPSPLDSRGIRPRTSEIT
jgi:hypothetical protein